MRLFTDNPIAFIQDDTFGFAAYVRVLKDTILETMPLPFCVGIFGPWGSGKTSFMQMIQGLMKNDVNVRTLWFNPWKYDKKEDLWNALIQTILYAIKEQSGDEIKKKIEKLALAATWLALKKSLTAFSAGIITESNLDAITGAFTSKDEKYYSHINRFEKDFAEVVDAYCNGGKLVVFIDDLDRCLPENAITVLESLKLFIGNANCIFVLGVDHDIVEEGINYRYMGKVKVSGRDYLDKIIQVPFFLPPVPFESLKVSVPADQSFSEEIWSIIQSGMGGNPRKTKRFINSFYLLQRFLHDPDPILQRRFREGSIAVLSQETQNFYLAKILVFEMIFPKFYQHLQYEPGDWRYLDEKVIQEDDGQRRQEALEKRGKESLALFWQEASFQSFMRKTSGRSYGYPAPTEEIVSLLLRATNLVAEKPL